MKDLMINQFGELAICNGDIRTCTDDELKFQKAICISKSVAKNWFIDNIGADLEQIVGDTISPTTISKGKELLYTSLSDVYIRTDIYIEEELDGTTIKYTVYLKNSDNISSRVLYVDIDLVAGINIRIGVD